MEKAKLKNRETLNRGAKANPARPATSPAALNAALGDSSISPLIGEAIALFHRLKWVSQQIHQQGEMSAGKGGILMGLDTFGPQTVPQMARARPVSRQYIQTLVNQLLKEGHVELTENSVHKRSSLVQLTPQGKKSLARMNRRQREILGKLEIQIAEKRLQTAAEVLRDVRKLLEGPQLKRLLKLSQE